VRNSHPDIKVSNVRASSGYVSHRVTADVDGVPLWYESDEVELSPAPEAFGAALLLPALHRGRRLSFDAPVCPAWLSNVGRLMKVWRGWWGYPELPPRAEARADARARGGETALCFSGGVDSFYTLLRGGHRPDLLVALHGFDIPLRDRRRMAAFERSLRVAAASAGAKAVVIRTNFREHPAAGRAGLWERAHGGALAAAGHLLAGRAGRLMISSTYSGRNQQPWGSSFMTDHFWSSGGLEVFHCGAEATREEKLQFLAGEPLAREHLRVCWENRSPEGNCSRCGKCLATMLMLAEFGLLDDFGAFARGADLVARVNALPYVNANVFKLDRLVRRGRLDPELNEAARRLVKRSLRVRRIRAYVSRLREVFV
jgi:hypothetical protein